MTKAELDVIEARANAAAPGPWTTAFTEITSADRSMMIYEEGGHTEQDAEFIAHAREDVPALVARLRILEQRELDIVTLVDFVVGWWPGLEDGIQWDSDLEQHPAIVAARRLADGA